MHRLPIQGMHQRIQQGDTLIVDLRPLIHMDAHKDACRRQLRHLGEESEFQFLHWIWKTNFY